MNERQCNYPEDNGHLNRLVWLPIPILIAAMGVLWALGPQTEYANSGLAMLLNFLTRTLASIFIVYLAGRSFLLRGEPGLLLLGCGVAVWGSSSFITSAILSKDPNLGVTISNLGFFLSGMCFLASTLISASSWRMIRNTGRWLTVAYALSLIAVALIAFSTFAGWLPVFFAQGKGGTLIRYIVLISAIALFVFSAVLLWASSEKRFTSFKRWYACALFLIAAGLFGMLIQSSRNTALDWTCRTAHYLGGIYMLIAAIAARRESRTGEISLAAKHKEYRGNAFMTELRKQTPRALLLRYGLAAAAVAVAMGLHLEITELFGQDFAPFIIFYPAIFLVALLCGSGPGLGATALSCFLLGYYILHPVGQFAISSPADRLALVLFSGLGLLICFMAELYRRNWDKAAAYDREEAVCESEERLRLALDAGSMATWDWNITTGGVVWNDEHYRMLGYAVGEVEPSYRAWTDRVHPDDIKATEAILRQSMEQGTEYVSEFRVLMPDGGIRWIEARGRFERNVSGQPSRSYGVLLNITGRKQVEEKLLEQDHRLNLALDAGSLAPWEINLATGEVINSPQLDRIFGLPDTAGMNLRENWKMSVLEEDRHLIQPAIEAAVANRTKYHVQFRIRRPDGAIRWIDSLGDLIADAQGRLTRLVGVCTDITEQKRTEESLNRNREFSEVLNRINKELHSTLEFGEVTQRLVDAGGAALGSDTATVSLRNTDGWTVSHVYGMPGAMVGMHMNDEEEKHALLALETGRPVPVVDAFNDKRFNREHLHRHNIRSVLVVPLIAHNKALGVMFFNYHMGIHQFTEAEINFSSQLAATATIALSNAFLYEEKKRAEESLRISEHRIQQALRISNSFTFEWIPATDQVLRSASCENILGIRGSDACNDTGTRFIQRIHPDDRTHFTEILRELTPVTDTYTIEYRVIRGDGNVVVLEEIGQGFFDSAGKLQRLAGVTTDITSRKKAEDALQASEEKYRLLFHNMAEGFALYELIFDESGKPSDWRVLEVNDAYTRHTGIGRERIVGRRISEVFPAAIPEYLPRFAEVVRTQHPSEFETYAKTVERHQHVITFPAGGSRFANIVEDITERKRVEGAFRKSEELNRKTLQALPAHIAVIDGQGRIIAVNQAWTDFACNNNATGSASVDVGANYCDVCRKAAAQDADAEEALSGIESVLSGTKEQFTMEYPCHSPDQQRWFFMTVVPFGSDGAVITHLNITERQKAQDALRESENRLSLAQEIAHLGSWELDLLTDRLTWSDEVFRIFGLRPQEFGATYEAFLEYVHPQDRAKVDEAYTSSLREKRDTYEIEHRVIRKDTGDIRIVHEKCEHFRDSSGKIIRSAGMVHDITERKQAESVLKTTLQRFYDVLSSMYSGVLLVTDDGRVEFANQALCDQFGLKDAPADLHGISSDEMLGKIKNACLHPEEAVKRIREIVAAGQPVKGEEIAMLDGHACLRDFLPLNVLGKSYGRLWIHVDITARQKAETALRQTLEDLQRSNKDLEQFAYVASHDLQEPLRMVSNFMGILQNRYKGRLDKDADEFIGFATDGASRMSSLIHDLLEYSRAGRPSAKANPVSCEEALAKALRNLHGTITEHNVMVTHDTLPTVTGDPTQLSQLFQNLVGNAIKFHRDGVRPEIHVSARIMDDDRQRSRPSPLWLFSVRDNGIGIDPQFHERIFMIFQRLHTRDKYPGTGIGLAICKKIVEHCGGRIWVESKTGEGSTFYFTLQKEHPK